MIFREASRACEWGNNLPVATNTTNAACGVSYGSSEGGNGHQSRSSRPDTMDTGQNPDQALGHQEAYRLPRGAGRRRIRLSVLD